MRLGSAAALLVALLTGCSAGNGDGTVSKDPPGADASTLEGLQARWWTWAASQPPGTNPVSDPTGEHCAVGQDDDVWLLAGSFGEVGVHRRCEVPGGRPLAGPVLNMFASEEQECAEFLARADGELLLDGAPQRIERLEPVKFEFSGVAGNQVNGAEGEVRAIGCGLWFRLDPLPAGEHTLVISGSDGSFEVEVTYELVVGPLT